MVIEFKFLDLLIALPVVVKAGDRRDLHVVSLNVGAQCYALIRHWRVPKKNRIHAIR